MNARRWTWVIGEAARNLSAWSAVVVPMCLLVSATAAFCAHWVLQETTSALAQQHRLDESGRQMVVVSLPEGALRGADCEALRTITGVRAAFGLQRVGSARSAAGDAVSVRGVTAGFADFVSFADGRHSTDRLFVGELVASAAGLVDGAAWSVLPSDEGATGFASPPLGTPVHAEVLAAGPRSSWYDDLVLPTVDPGEPVTECRVEASDRMTAEIVGSIEARFQRSARPLVRPFDEALARTAEPERRLHASTRSPVALIPGFVGALVALGWWFIRRVEWTLYRTFGVGVGRRLLVALIEWAAMALLPLIVGSSWAIAFAHAATPIQSVVTTLWLALASALLSLVCVPLWVAYTAARSPYALLQGR